MMIEEEQNAVIIPSPEEVRKFKNKLIGLKEEEKILNDLIDAMRKDLLLLTTENDYEEYAYLTPDDIL